MGMGGDLLELPMRLGRAGMFAATRAGLLVPALSFPRMSGAFVGRLRMATGSYSTFVCRNPAAPTRQTSPTTGCRLKSHIPDKRPSFGGRCSYAGTDGPNSADDASVLDSPCPKAWAHETISGFRGVRLRSVAFRIIHSPVLAIPSCLRTECVGIKSLRRSARPSIFDDK